MDRETAEDISITQIAVLSYYFIRTSLYRMYDIATY